MTIDLLVKWVNSEEFLGGKSKCEDTGIEVDERERLEKFGISFPIDRDVVYGWMQKAGATCERDGDKKTYYTDGHNREDVVDYREKIYTPTMKKLEERMHLYLNLTSEEILTIEEGSGKKLPVAPRKIAEDLYEVHVDDSEAYIAMRAKLKFGGELRIGATSETKPLRADWSCDHRHSYETCRCWQPALSTGQDESIYHNNEQSKVVWAVDGCRPIRPKEKGKGAMDSAFVDSARGLGLPMSAEELAVSSVRHTRKLTRTDRSDRLLVTAGHQPVPTDPRPHRRPHRITGAPDAQLRQGGLRHHRPQHREGGKSTSNPPLPVISSSF